MKYNEITETDLLKCEFKIMNTFEREFSERVPIEVYAKKLSTSTYQVRKVIKKLEQKGYCKLKEFRSEFETVDYDWEKHGMREEEFKPLKYKAFVFDSKKVDQFLQENDYVLFKAVKDKYKKERVKYFKESENE